MSKRARSIAIQWGIFAVGLGAVGAVLYSTVSWAKLGDAYFRWDVFKAQFPVMITEGVVNTLFYTFIAFTGGLVFALIAATMRQSQVVPARWLATTYVEVLRALPALLTILLVGYGIKIAFSDYEIPGFFNQNYGKGGLALALVAGAYMAESIRAGLQAVPKGQTEAARSLGLSSRQTLRRIVMPQALRIVVPPLTNEFVLLLKDTSLLYVLGVTVGERELVTIANQARSASFNSTPLTAAAVCFIAITLPLTYLVKWVERRTEMRTR